MSLESIQNYCGKKNFAGNTHIQCVPIQWVEEFPDYAKDGHNFSEQITLKPGKVWLLFPCAADTIDFGEKERSGGHGTINTPTITGFIPNDTPQIASVLNSAKANQWISILYYKTGEAKVIGSPDIPARFSSSLNNRGNLNSGKGYDIEFFSQSAVKSFFVGELPDPISTGCLPANVRNKASNATYSTMIASGGVLILPKEDITVNGVLLLNKDSVEDYDVLVVDTNDDPVATSIVGGKVQVDALPAVQDLDILIPYKTNHTYAEITVVSDSAGTINTSDTTGLSSVVLRKNGTVVTLPFSIAVGDLLSVDFDAAGADGVIKLEGSYV